jgi:camphor 5-monooxygenase
MMIHLSTHPEIVAELRSDHLKHGLDSAANENPLLLDLSRRKISHSTFGDGPHRCAGMHLARLEVTVTLEEWLRHIPTFRLQDGAKPIYQSGIIAAVENVPLVWN